MGTRSLKVTLAKGALLLAIGAFLVAATLPANAATLGSNGSGGDPTGNYLFAWYDIGTPVGSNPVTPAPNYGVPGGDNIIRLIDPNGCGNGFVSNDNCANEALQCALIYVFDDDQEMGECCPCLLTGNGLLTISVRNNLVDNWALATQDNSRGTIIVIGSLGCDPTQPAFTEGASNLVGSITHDQSIDGRLKLTEIPLFDQGGGETVNNTYLGAECASLLGNGSGSGSCFCESPEIDGVPG